MNKFSIVLAMLLILCTGVMANAEDLTPFYTAEQKNIDIGDTFDIKCKGMFTVKLDSGMEIQVGVDRPTRDDKDCSYSTSEDSPCESLAVSVSSPVTDAAGSISLHPGITSMISTPYFNIILLEMKNNSKKENLVYTLKILDAKPRMIYVTANENFTLLPGQTAKRGIYEIESTGVGYEGQFYLRFLKNGEEFRPESKYFKNGSYWMLFGGQFRKEPLACLEPSMCVYAYGFNLQDYNPKNDYSIAVMGYEMTLAIIETQPPNQEADVPEAILIKANATAEIDKENPDSDNSGNLQENLSLSAEPNVTVKEIIEEPQPTALDENPLKIAPVNGLEEEQKGLLKSIGNFFRSIFGRK